MSEHADTNPELVLDTDNIVGLDHTYWPKHIRIEQSRYLEGMDPEGILALEMFDDDTGEDWATMSVNLSAYGRGAFPPINNNNDDNDNSADNGDTNSSDWMYTYIKDQYLPFIVALVNMDVAQIDDQIMYGPFNSAAWLVKFDVTKIGDMRFTTN